MASCSKTKLENVLSCKQICHVLNQTVQGPCRIVGHELKPATEGLSGFLGDHFKIILYAENEKKPKAVHLFAKTIPMANKPKADFITTNNFFKKEALMYKLFDDINAAEDANSWCAKAYIYTENLIVLPNLTVEGYTLQPVSEYLDLDHVLLAVKSLAKFHAVMANYFMKKDFDRNELCKSIDGFENYINEPAFTDSPWLRTAAKVLVNFLKIFSVKYKDCVDDLEENIVKLFIQACDSLNKTHDTLNVLIHRDMWVNNIMFKYENNVPTEAILIDYQCSRYAPPAFDIMIFLYLTTSRTAREHFHAEVLSQYFKIFSHNIDTATKRRLKEMNYNREQLNILCEEARMFGLIESIAIFPYILLDSKTAEETYDNPETFDKYQFEDRSEPVLTYARKCTYFREKLLEVCEEFFERYVLCLH